MLQEFNNYTKEKGLLNGGRVLLAVSGGIDSMVMAHIFMKLKIPSAIAHCNFCLRGNESDLDEQLVREFAAKHKVKFHTKRFDTTGFARDMGISIQMAARELRYKWFGEICVEYGYESVAIAHNLNDNIETLLLNLTRGTGILGLTGIKASANHVIRPLLFSTREAISEYSVRNRVKFREDSSNPETKYARNKIRHLVIPVLKKINPSVEATLNETSLRMSETNDIVNYFTDSILKCATSSGKDGSIQFRLDALHPFEDNVTMIYEIFRTFGITGDSAWDLKNIIAGPSGGQVITPAFRLMKNRNVLIIIKHDREEFSPITVNSIAGLKKIPWLTSVKKVTIAAGFSISKDPDVATIDFSKLAFPVTIRKWKAGDVFYPFGMNKKKKLSDYFIDRKISIAEKENMLVFESAGEIMWIPGERIDDHFRITENTLEALIMHSSR
jgi:tRNA(Ile)-lysidine synthase